MAWVMNPHHISHIISPKKGLQIYLACKKTPVFVFSLAKKLFEKDKKLVLLWISWRKIWLEQSWKKCP